MDSQGKISGMEDNSRRICSLELRFSTEDTLLLVNSLSRKEHNLQSKGAQGIAYMAHVFQNLPATFYKPLESGMQGAYAMHLFYRKLWLTALWMWNSCLSEIYQNCSLLLWRNGFAEAVTKRCKLDTVWDRRCGNAVTRT